MSTYEDLEKAAAHLKKCERGRTALKNLSRFANEGGIGLDRSNKNAVAKLFLACLENPNDLPAWFVIESEVGK